MAIQGVTIQNEITDVATGTAYTNLFCRYSQINGNISALTGDMDLSAQLSYYLSYDSFVSNPEREICFMGSLYGSISAVMPFADLHATGLGNGLNKGVWKAIKMQMEKLSALGGWGWTVEDVEM